MRAVGARSCDGCRVHSIEQQGWAEAARFCAPYPPGWPWWARFAVPSLRLRFSHDLIRSYRAERPSLPRLIEISQIGRLLAFASRHQIAIGAQKIILFADG